MNHDSYVLQIAKLKARKARHQSERAYWEAEVKRLEKGESNEGRSASSTEKKE